MKRKTAFNKRALIKFSIFLLGEEWLRDKPVIKDIAKILCKKNLKNNNIKMFQNGDKILN